MSFALKKDLLSICVYPNHFSPKNINVCSTLTSS